MEGTNLNNTLFSYISRAHNRGDAFLCRELEKRGIKGLVYSHICIIAILSIYTRLSMKEISEKITKDKSTVTFLVNKLEKLGYIRKKISEKDRRIIYIVLETKAEEIISAIKEVAEIFDNRVREILNNEEMETLLKLMSKLVNNF